MPAVINFYAVNDEYGEFSNFAPYPIVLHGKRWPTSEHYFQAQKFAGTPHAEEIRRAKKPRIAADMGRDRKRPLRRDWESVKDNVMLDALRAKFTQHADLRDLLLGAGRHQCWTTTEQANLDGSPIPEPCLEAIDPDLVWISRWELLTRTPGTPPLLHRPAHKPGKHGHPAPDALGDALLLDGGDAAAALYRTRAGWTLMHLGY